MSIFTLPLKSIRLLLFLLIYSVGLLVTYCLFLQGLNESVGYRIINLSFIYLLGSVVSLIFAAILIPVKISKPSDFFLLFYSLLIIAPYGLLHSIMEEIVILDFLKNITILLLPAIIVKLITINTIKIIFPELVTNRKIINLIITVTIFVTIYVFFNQPDASGFDIESSYVRRLEVRELFTASSFAAYSWSIVLNGFLPIIAFFSGLQRRNLLVVISLICGVLFFYTIGIKAHFLMIGLGYMLGRNMRLNQLPRIQYQIYLLVIFIFGIFIIEYILSGYSYIADYLIRRLFTIPPYIISGYFDIMENSRLWSFWTGIDYPGGVTYLVGERYFNDAQANANTNTFLYQLAAGGAPMFFSTIGLVTLVFLLIDSIYIAKRNRVFMYIGFIYSILLIEQNATTALLSSGVGLLLILFLIGADTDP